MTDPDEADCGTAGCVVRDAELTADFDEEGGGEVDAARLSRDLRVSRNECPLRRRLGDVPGVSGATVAAADGPGS